MRHLSSLGLHDGDDPAARLIGSPIQLLELHDRSTHERGRTRGQVRYAVLTPAGGTTDADVCSYSCSCFVLTTTRRCAGSPGADVGSPGPRPRGKHPTPRGADACSSEPRARGKRPIPPPRIRGQVRSSAFRARDSAAVSRCGAQTRVVPIRRPHSRRRDERRRRVQFVLFRFRAHDRPPMRKLATRRRVQSRTSRPWKTSDLAGRRHVQFPDALVRRNVRPRRRRRGQVRCHPHSRRREDRRRLVQFLLFLGDVAGKQHEAEPVERAGRAHRTESRTERELESNGRAKPGRGAARPASEPARDAGRRGEIQVKPPGARARGSGRWQDSTRTKSECQAKSSRNSEPGSDPDPSAHDDRGGKAADPNLPRTAIQPSC